MHLHTHKYINGVAVVWLLCQKKKSNNNNKNKNVSKEFIMVISVAIWNYKKYWWINTLKYYKINIHISEIIIYLSVCREGFLKILIKTFKINISDSSKKFMRILSNLYINY